MTSCREAEVRQGTNVAEAAAAAGVAHVVYGAAGVGEERTGIDSWDSKRVVPPIGPVGWLCTDDLDLSTARTRELLPEARSVPGWLAPSR